MADEKLTIQQKIVLAYAEMTNPPLDSTNPHFKNKFASLKATLAVIRKGCAKYGLAYLQPVMTLGDRLVLNTFVMDDDGGTYSLSQFPLTPNPDPQKFGSLLTYAKRQAAQADWGLVGDPDDDAEAAAAPAKSQPKAQPKTRDYSALKVECERLAAIHSTSVNDEWAWVCSTYGNPKAMSDEEYATLVRVLQNMERE